MKNPKISVIVPIYNVSMYLDRCMQSLLNQTFKDIEIILVDDGSPDDCGLKCDEYAKSNERVTVIHKKNAGLGFARNSGLSIAKGKYVGFVDSDDYVELDMYKNLYEGIVESNADLCFCKYFNVDSSGNKVKAKETYSKSEYQNSEVQQVLLGMIGSNLEQKEDVEIGMSVWKGLYSMDILKNNNIQFPSEREFISEDIIFHIEYFKYCKTVKIMPYYGYNYCDNGDSLTKSYKVNRFEMEKKLYYKELQELDENYPKITYDQRLYKSFLGRVRNCISQEIYLNTNYRTANMNITNICSDELVQDVLDKFNFKKCVMVKRIFNFFIKYKQVTLLRILFKIKKIYIK